MARPIHVWLSSLTLCALSACGGREDGFFSDVVKGAAGSNQAGAAAQAGSSSSGGNPGSAGTPSSGGSAGTPSGGAGTPSGGGHVEAGGSGSAGAHSGGASSGGRGGASGSGGTGGSRAGAGGGGASGGRAGAPGSAGSGGTSSHLTCDELLELADDQLAAARTCNGAASSPQCTSTVTNLCNCEVPVAKTAEAETKAYLATLKLIKDKDCARVCPKIACTEVNNAQCQPSDHSAMGTCVVSHSGPQL